MTAMSNGRVPVPRDKEDDYTRDAAGLRQTFLQEKTGAQLEHVSSYSIDPAVLAGNIEQFLGAAQVPIGVAGPLLVDGEHAQGEFYVPLATAEGTLVASYNRGMKLLYAAGGVKTTVIDDRMQRAPCFLFASAREAREFSAWLDEHFDEIKAAAEATTRVGPPDRDREVLGQPDAVHPVRLHDRRRRRPEPHRQGDAGGLPRGSSSSAPTSSSTSSSPTSRRTRRARRSTSSRRAASASSPRRRSPTSCCARAWARAASCCYRAREVANLGGFMAGVNNNGAHSANGITAIFIATGQDVGERRGVLGGARLRRASPERRLLLLRDDPVADRRDLRRRHRAARRSASASSCSAATERARCSSWRRSSPPRCCAGRSRSARRSSPRTG